MKLTGPQIAAAIALAGISREDLATEAGIGRNTLDRIINGLTTYRDETIKKITGILEARGIEFTDNQGVRVRQTGVEVYEGPERFNDFYDFLYTHMLEQGGEVCLMVADESMLAKYRTNPELQRQRMRELVMSGKVAYRVIVSHGDFTGDYVEYRHQPASSAVPTAFYAFGECLALISFPQERAPNVVCIRSIPLTQAYRQAFHAAWDKAKVVSEN